MTHSVGCRGTGTWNSYITSETLPSSISISRNCASRATFAPAAGIVAGSGLVGNFPVSIVRPRSWADRGCSVGC